MRSRLGKGLFVIGMALIMCSMVMVGREHSQSIDISFGDYRGLMIKTTGGVYAEVEAENQSFSLFLLTYNEMLSVMQIGSMENASVLFEKHNMTSFAGTIHVLIPGWYGLLFTPQVNRTLSFRIHIAKPVPREGFFIPGVVIAGLGALVHVARVARLRRS